MGIKSVFASDAVKTSEGVWFDIESAQNTDGTIPGVLLARANDANPAYRAALEKHTTRIRKAMSLGLMVSPAEVRAAMIESYADAVILEWRYIQYPNDGDKFPCNKENVRRILTEMPDFFTYCASNAGERVNYTSEEEEKN